MRSRLWLLYLAALLPLVAAHFLVGTTAQALIYPVFALSAGAAAVYAGRTSAHDRAFWLLLAAAIVLLLAGDTAYSARVLVGAEVPVPSEMDALYLLAYVPLIAATRALAGRHWWGGAFEAAIVGVGVFLVAWVFMLRDPLADSAGTGLADATALAYPVGCMLVAAAATQAVFSGRSVDPRLLVALVGVGLLVGGDLGYAKTLFYEGYTGGSAIDAAWVTAYLLWGAAALAPSSRRWRLPSLRPRITGVRVALLIASVVGANLLLLFRHTDEPFDSAVLFAGSTAVALLALARAWQLAAGQERLLAEARTSRERLSELVDTAGAIVSEFDVETGRITYLTGAVERITGYDAASYLSDQELWSRRVPLEDRQTMQELRRSAVAEGTGYTTDYRFRRPDGRVIWLRTNGAPAGRSGRIRAVTMDVTELKTALAEQAATASLLEASLDATADGIIVTDLEGEITLANARAGALWGIDPAEMVADRKRLGERVQALFPDFAALRATIDAIVSDPSCETEDVLELVDGRTIERRSSPQRVGDEIVGRVWSFRDVTAARRADESLRRREEHFRSLIENSTDVISILGLDGTVRYESPSIERVFGWRQDELVGLNAFDYIHPDDLERVAQIFLDGVAAGLGTFQAADFRFRRGDGSWCRVESIGQLREDEEGEQIVVVNSRDVTERRELEERLLHSQKLEAVGRLAGGVAHDFNNLLTAIGGYTEFLLGSIEEGDPRRDDVVEIARAAERATALTAQLLAFSRRQVLQPETLDVAEVVDGVQKLLARLLGADIELRTAGDEGCLAHVDRGQLEQVLTNLAVNARDAMPGGGTLAIETRRETRDGRTEVVVTVTDTGEGMDEETLEHAFEPFFTTKEKGKGTGLGLATVYGIVAQSGGTVEAASTPGLGSTVTVRLPLAAATEAPVEQRRAPEVHEGAGTIVLAEDEDMIRRLVRDVLTRNGYRVVDAPSGEPALELLRAEERVDLLLTDVVMPGMSGPALASAATAERPGLRVLFMSGYTNQPEQLFGEPGSAFIGKPFSPQALVAKVREVLDARDVPV